MADLYRIKDWAKNFETAQSRRYKSLSWVAIPNKHDGMRFRRLMAREDGPSVFGAWMLIVQVASKCSPRGILASDGKPLEPIDLHFKTGVAESVFKLAFEVLSTPEIGWIEKVETENEHSTDNQRQSESENTPSPNIHAHDTVPNQTKQNPTGQTEQNKTQPDNDSVGFKEFFEKFGVDSGLVGKVAAKITRLTGCKEPSDLAFIDRVAILNQIDHLAPEVLILEAAKAVKKEKPDSPMGFFRKCLQNRIVNFEEKISNIPCGSN